MTVRLFAAARAAAGTPEVVVPPGATASVLSAVVAATRPDLGDVLPRCSLLVDGVRLDPGDERVLRDGDIIDVLPPFAGG